MSDIKKTIHTATNPMKSAMDGVKDAARQVADPLGDLENGKKTGGSKGDNTSSAPKPDDAESAKRDAQARKIQAATARAAAERKRREADEAIKAAEAAEAAADQPAKDTKDL